MGNISKQYLDNEISKITKLESSHYSETFKTIFSDLYDNILKDFFDRINVDFMNLVGALVKDIEVCECGYTTLRANDYRLLANYLNSRAIEFEFEEETTFVESEIEFLFHFNIQELGYSPSDFIE